MFLSSLFFKPSHKKAGKMFKKFIKKTNLDGMPGIHNRKKWNFRISQDVDWKGTAIFVYATMDGYTVEFDFFYFKKYKSVTCNVTFPKLNLNYSTKGMQMIRENHPKFIFDFGPNNNTSGKTVIKFDKYIKKESEFNAVLDSFRREWNSSGLYKLMMDLKKI